MDERLTEIEIKLAHAEQSIAELSDVMYRQQGVLDRLERQLADLRQRVNEAPAGTPGASPDDEKPPHY